MNTKNAGDLKKSLEQRISWERFVTKNKPEVEAMEAAHQKFNELFLAISNAKDSPEAKVIAEMKTPFIKAKDELNKIADLGKTGWAKKEATGEKEFSTALKNYNDANDTLRKFLSDTEKFKGVGVPTALKDAYNKMSEMTLKVTGKMDGPLGALHIDGWKATAEHNLKFWDKEIAQGRTAEFAMRGASVAAGAGLAYDSLARGVDKENEPRSVVARILEGATGVALIGGAALAGAAR